MILYSIKLSDRHWVSRHKSGWHWRCGCRGGTERAGRYRIFFELLALACLFTFCPAVLVPMQIHK